MTKKQIFIRFAGLAAFTAAAVPLWALCINLLIFAHMIPVETADHAYFADLTQKTMIVWICAFIAGSASIFVKDSWRWILYSSPFWAPSVFAVTYNVMQM